MAPSACFLSLSPLAQASRDAADPIFRKPRVSLCVRHRDPSEKTSGYSTHRPWISCLSSWILPSGLSGSESKGCKHTLGLPSRTCSPNFPNYTPKARSFCGLDRLRTASVKWLSRGWWVGVISEREAGRPNDLSKPGT